MKSREILENFKKEAEQSKLSASYLFYGDKRVDLLFYALQFSKIVMTVGFAENSPEKKEIERKIDNYQYPDVEVINRENENIKIDEIREIIYSAIESSYNSPKKIFILSGVENLRKESSNALLKILEEPPKDVYFILLSRSLDIIPTIKSRTVKFHLESENNEELGVSREVYYFFDGNESNIKTYIKNDINLEDYSKNIKTVDDVLKGIITMKRYMNKEIGVENEIELIIIYNQSIRFLCKKIKIMKLEDIYIIINELEKEYRQEREKLVSLLDRIIVNSRTMLSLENFKKLINIKNSIRNNVNIRSVLFNFFEYLKD